MKEVWGEEEANIKESIMKAWPSEAAIENYERREIYERAMFFKSLLNQVKESKVMNESTFKINEENIIFEATNLDDPTNRGVGQAKHPEDPSLSLIFGESLAKYKKPSASEVKYNDNEDLIIAMKEFCLPKDDKEEDNLLLLDINNCI